MCRRFCAEPRFLGGQFLFDGCDGGGHAIAALREADGRVVETRLNAATVARSHQKGMVCFAIRGRPNAHPDFGTVLSRAG
jgi:hypothetical protein